MLVAAMVLRPVLGSLSARRSRLKAAAGKIARPAAGSSGSSGNYAGTLLSGCQHWS
jgi:hypothetical protein